MSTTRLGILLSGGGRTLQNLLECIDDGALDARVAAVAADREAFGLQRAQRAAIPHLLSKDDSAIYAFFVEHGVELICLCGYLRLFPIRTGWENRVLNIHPSLLPRHGGPGYYGRRVHEAVLAAGDIESGCTVHYCDDHYDQGPVLVQISVPVLPGDDADALAARVFAAECEAYPEAIRRWRATHHGKPSSA